MSSAETTTTEPTPGRAFAPLIPGLILAGIVLLGAGLTLRARGTPVVELRKILDNGNPAARAKPLADFQGDLKKKEDLAADPEVALELLARIDRTLTLSLPAEKQFANDLLELKRDAADAERQMLLPDREYLGELFATLPCTMLPVGLPLLNQLATNEIAAEADYRTTLRRAALTALGTLGESVERCERLSEEGVQELAGILNSVRSTPRINAGSKAGVEYLQRLVTKQPDMLGVDKTVLACAQDKDPVLRRGAAFCARHWPGTPEQNAAVEAMLRTLLDDQGAGPGPKENKPGFSIRSQAALSLAWRASAKTPLPKLVELLDPAFLSASLGEGSEPLAVDLASAALTATTRLALQRKKVPTLDLAPLKGAVEKLSREAKNPNVQALAEVARAALEQAP